MSNLEAAPQEIACGGGATVAVTPVRELLAGSDVVLTPRGIRVLRTLPSRDRRMVGAWCFLDHYGPVDIDALPDMRMRVPPHPHIGLQTVSWLLAGDVLHRDSLGSVQLIRPSQLNLMTAGRGIAHSEETPPQHSSILHGVQLWTVLPDRHRQMDPQFQHHSRQPVLADGGVTATVIVGELGGVASPAAVYSPLVGADVSLAGGTDTRLPLEPDFEYAVLTLSGSAEVDSVALPPGPLLYLGCGRSDLALRAERPSRLLLLGGEPFEEQIVMWWNFVARDHDEIVTARENWMAAQRFGTVDGYDGKPLPAPPMPNARLRPRGRHR